MDGYRVEQVDEYLLVRCAASGVLPKAVYVDPHGGCGPFRYKLERVAYVDMDDEVGIDYDDRIDCPLCGGDVYDTDRYCSSCGVRIERVRSEE